MITSTLAISSGLAIVMGILVLAFPKLLRWAIGIYLIAAGILQLMN